MTLIDKLGRAKACLKALDAQTLTDMTDTGDWGPTTDGVTFPDDPEKLLQDGKVNDASVILGFQTNDNFLFLSRDYTTGHLPQPNDHPDGALVHMNTSQLKEPTAPQGGRAPRNS